jgi:hypothetical protein
LYVVAADLAFSNTWLESYVQNEISNKAKYMSRTNIVDILGSLDKSNPMVSQLERELSTRPE